MIIYFHVLFAKGELMARYDGMISGQTLRGLPAHGQDLLGGIGSVEANVLYSTFRE